jgi:hypothetical protein
LKLVTVSGLFRRHAMPRLIFAAIIAVPAPAPDYRQSLLKWAKEVRLGGQLCAEA